MVDFKNQFSQDLVNIYREAFTVFDKGIDSKIQFTIIIFKVLKLILIFYFLDGDGTISLIFKYLLI